ncbi:MAG: hypothetical protein H6Q69_2833 [Firmicutes bacterium]|nr:hypothetical protein [Bacillota bacterium]MBP2659801.1 hypothetical protein [Bacillota bacterium]
MGTKTEYITGSIVSIMGTAFSYAIGGFDQMMIALTIFMVIDYLTGVIAAYGYGVLNSKKGFSGIVKKFVIMAIVTMAHQLDLITGQDALIKTMVTWFFIGNEGLSMLENAAKIGVPIPGVLKDRLAQLTKQKGVRS